MVWSFEYSEAPAGPYEPLLRLTAATWAAAEREFFAGIRGVLGFGYYRVRRYGADKFEVYVWDGDQAALRLLEN